MSRCWHPRRVNLASLQKKSPILLRELDDDSIVSLNAFPFAVSITIRITRYACVSRYRLISSELMKCPAFLAMQDKSLTD